MNLVDEEHGAFAERAPVLRFGNDFAQIGNTGADGRDRSKMRIGHARDDFGQRGFTGAGRSPEDQRRNVVRFDCAAQRMAFSNDVLLTDELVERARPHARGKRRCGGRGGLEQTRFHAEQLPEG